MCKRICAKQMLYEILSVSCDIALLLGLRVDRNLPCTRVFNRLARNSSRQKAICRTEDDKWEIPSGSGILIKKKEVIT